MQWVLELSSGKRFVGIAVHQVKFLGVIKKVPGAQCALFVYNLYVICFHLPLLYHCLSSVLQTLCTYSQQFFNHITQIRSFSIVSAAISQLHCSLLSSHWALLLLLSVISQISTAGMCRPSYLLPSYLYYGVISHHNFSSAISYIFGDQSVLKILYSFLLVLICQYHYVIPSIT